ncbi:VTT domain-containing protein [Magnetospira thiophila]
MFLKGLLVLLSMVAIGFALKTLGGGFDSDWIDHEIRGQGLAGEALFVAVCALAAAVGLPRQMVAFLGGYAFGLVGGTLLALLAVVLGCAFAFAYARLVGRSFIARRFGLRIARVDSFLADNPFSMTLLIRLLPAGSNLVTNLVAGVTSVGALPFIAGSALGYIPQTLVFALAGSGVDVDPELRISLSIALFVVSGLLGLYLYRRFRQGRSIDETPDHALDGDD